MWYYTLNNQQVGPVDEAEIKKLVEAGKHYPRDARLDQRYGQLAARRANPARVAAWLNPPACSKGIHRSCFV